MRIVSVDLKNFRCFNQLSVDLNRPIVLIVGPNGIGKTSILEALHYLCYLRSFKTHLPKEFVKINQSACAITVNIASQIAFDSICATVATNSTVGTNLSKRTIKLNQKAITTYKELYAIYKTVSIIEDDLQIIQGSPIYRRNFIDQMLLLMDPNYNRILKNHKAIVDNRNALLASKGANDRESYLLWTEQLFNSSLIIQKTRQVLLDQISKYAQACALSMGLNYQIELKYDYAKIYCMADISFEKFTDKYITKMLPHELGFKRSLFGAHLDDFSVSFQEKSSRVYASRGQQKLLVILLKLAQLHVLKESNSDAILLIDDFITDFDESKIRIILSFIKDGNLARQTIITCALKLFDLNLFSSLFNPDDIQVVDLTQISNI